ncbi:hypothetical protein DL546_001630 [Coniochaeta pulveracea]|uniref:Uncharacterized protein n=1 Tax=Coniochaeta pulveracea TaxID=177199 RepID=A0A420Y462_9PEZI|nr:hypothetical protein DL546_001630 [Coniochaeta pulveracea]
MTAVWRKWLIVLRPVTQTGIGNMRVKTTSTDDSVNTDAQLQRAPVVFARHISKKLEEGFNMAIDNTRTGLHGLTAEHQDTSQHLDQLASAKFLNHATVAAKDIV